MAHDVFISYAMEDKVVADAACATLEGRRVRCWIAPRDIQPAEEYAGALAVAIAESRVLMVILSESSNKSTHVNKEVQVAVAKGIAIIPFRIEEIDLSPAMNFFLGNLHWLDALSPPLEEHLERLGKRIIALLQAGEAPTVEARGAIAARIPGPRLVAGDAEPVVPTSKPRRLHRVALAATVALAGIILVALILRGGGRWGPGQGQVIETTAAKQPDPCDPNALPSANEPILPENPPPNDPARPLLPPDPTRTVCAVTIRNNTGKQLRIWRHVYRPTTDHAYSKWRSWLACKNPVPPPPAVAGWAYFVVEDLDDNQGDASTFAYYIVGWKFLDYGGFATIRLAPEFFRDPEGAGAFTIEYVR